MTWESPAGLLAEAGGLFLWSVQKRHVLHGGCLGFGVHQIFVAIWYGKATRLVTVFRGFGFGYGLVIQRKALLTLPSSIQPWRMRSYSSLEGMPLSIWPCVRH